MKNELDLMEMTLKLDKKDSKDFLNWYMSHPYTVGIRELVKNVYRQRGGRNENIEGRCIICNQHKGSECSS